MPAHVVLFLCLFLLRPLLGSAADTASMSRQQDQQPTINEVKHVGGPVKPPVVVYQPELKFTKEARKAFKNSHEKTFDDTVKVYCWVEPDGTVSHVRVIKGIGLGLDEAAAQAVRRYRFKPATLEGQPVTVDLYIEVRFQMH
jgi:protein TonB